jgi:anti-anti-sigma factor
MDSDTPTATLPPTPVSLGPELTIAHAAAWRDTLVDALCTSAGNLTLDLASVTDVDSAGLQLLLATKRSVTERGAVLALANVPGPVVQALAVFGLDQQLDATGGGTGAAA